MENETLIIIAFAAAALAYIVYTKRQEAKRSDAPPPRSFDDLAKSPPPGLLRLCDDPRFSSDAMCIEALNARNAKLLGFGGHAPIGLSKDNPAVLKQDLKSVNHRVNHGATYEADKPFSDDWSPLRDTAGAGDCDSFATEKYLILRDGGVPASRMAVVALKIQSKAGRPEWGHAVLLVRMNGRIYALDNRSDDVVDVDNVRQLKRYTYIPEYLRLGFDGHIPT